MTNDEWWNRLALSFYKIITWRRMASLTLMPLSTCLFFLRLTGGLKEFYSFGDCVFGGEGVKPGLHYVSGDHLLTGSRLQIAGDARLTFILIGFLLE